MCLNEGWECSLHPQGGPATESAHECEPQAHGLTPAQSFVLSVSCTSPSGKWGTARGLSFKAVMGLGVVMQEWLVQDVLQTARGMN